VRRWWPTRGRPCGRWVPAAGGCPGCRPSRWLVSMRMPTRPPTRSSAAHQQVEDAGDLPVTCLAGPQAPNQSR
jgi:hypothetical protein